MSWKPPGQQGGWGQGGQQGGWGGQQGGQQGWGGQQGGQQGWGQQGQQQGWGQQGQQHQQQGGWGQQGTQQQGWGQQGTQQQGWGQQGQQQQWGQGFNQGGQSLFNPNQYYEIESALDNDKVLDVSMSNKIGNKFKMIIYKRNNGQNQRFRLVNVGGDRYQMLVNLNGNYAVEVPNGSTQPGEQILIGPVNNQNN